MKNNIKESNENYETLDLKNLLNKFEKNRNKERSIKQSKYLLNQFDFYGIRIPELKNIFAEEIKLSKTIDINDLWLLVFEMQKQKERDWENLAQIFLKTNIKKMNKKDIDKIINSILINPWWDSVDSYSSILSLVFLKINDWNYIEEIIYKMNKDQSIWLKRSSLIVQNKFKEKTDLNLQFNLIKNVWNIKSFWIQKAIGWSLREISKTYPFEVEIFIKENQDNLSKLAIKEGMKRILKNGT